MGVSDFQQNYWHVKKILDCLNETFDNKAQGPPPCSLNSTAN